MEELNSNYVKKLRDNFEVVIQDMMDELDRKIVRLKFYLNKNNYFFSSRNGF